MGTCCFALYIGNLSVFFVKLTPIEPQGFSELVVQGFCMQMMHGAVFALIQYIVLYMGCESEEKTFYFSNYEEFDECMYGTCGVQYLQQG